MAAILEKLKSWTLPWRDIVPSGGGGDLPDLQAHLPDDQLDYVRAQMLACLENKGGEVSARQRAAALGQAYLGLNDEGRIRFLSLLVDDFGIDEELVRLAIAKYQAHAETDESHTYEIALRRALEPARMTLLRQFNALPQGVKFLVDLRADLMRLSKQDKRLKIVEKDLKQILIAWFDVGFLELQRLTWNSPASILEKIAEYEAVHSIQSWNDLKNRLSRDRRLFAFFHPRMPEEPLIFVEVALVNGMSDNVQELLDEEAPLLDPRAADTAIFYSISNAQEGLAGISFGNFLIKRVVANLTQDLPNIKKFATLSPIPGFRRWLEQALAEGDRSLLLPGERDILKQVSGQKGAKGALKDLLLQEDWMNDKITHEAMKAPLQRLCARYLSEEKRKGTRTLDPVAHFHLSNGARMERLNWMGDVSEKGMQQSVGMMINYLYKISEIEKNHERYHGRGRITMSSDFKNLLKG